VEQRLEVPKRLTKALVERVLTGRHAWTSSSIARPRCRPTPEAWCGPPGGEAELIELLRRYPYRGELWSRRNPSLVNILEDEP
jgi:hypothetical protein